MRILVPALLFVVGMILGGIMVEAWTTSLEECTAACAQSGGVVEHSDGGICRCRPSCIRGRDLPLQHRIIEEILDEHRARGATP